MKKTLGITTALAALLALTGCGSSADTEACELVQDEFNELNGSYEAADAGRVEQAQTEARSALNRAKSVAEDTDLHVAMVTMFSATGRNAVSDGVPGPGYFSSMATIEELCSSEHGVEFVDYDLPKHQ